jgi:hypothetical protein
MEQARTTGIDFGFSEKRPSFGYAQFQTDFIPGAQPKFVIRVRAETVATSLDEFIDETLESEVVAGADLVTLDAPITPVRIMERPKSGRCVERRFSRGDFSNGKRGPQPSSIAVPAQGWPLYCAAMSFLESVKTVGISPFHLPAADDGKRGCCLHRKLVEVLPKLTMALLTPRERIRTRPSADRFYWQIDNWLFPHLFVRDQMGPEAEVRSGSPCFGLDTPTMLTLLGADVTLDDSVWSEALRIQREEDIEIRHEMIGAFVAGFQGAISFAGKAQLIGCAGDSEGYYLLPASWHDEWLAVWNEKPKRKKQHVETVYSLSVGGLGRVSEGLP